MIPRFSRVLALFTVGGLLTVPGVAGPAPAGPDFTSAYLAVGLSRETPRFAYLSVDSLGHAQVAVNPVWRNAPVTARLPFTAAGPADFRYGTNGSGWTVHCAEKTLTLRSEWREGAGSLPAFELVIDQKANHATLLGLMEPGERRVQLPAVLHLPDLGSFRIHASVPGVAVDYDARRYLEVETPHPPPYVKVSFPAATATRPVVEYTLEVAAISPAVRGMNADPVFDGFRRNFLNIFQVNPHIQMLANNASSDPCTFTVYEYAEVARHAPALVDDLRPLDLVRMTLDRYLAGMKGYGQAGFAPTPEAPDLGRWEAPYDSLDALPSLLIAACYYAEGAQDWEWARHHYPALAAWARKVFAEDRDGNGLIEYPQSGNYLPAEKRGGQYRPANWWDAIMFGHEDAYSNALAYRAGTLLAALAERLGHREDATFLRGRTAQLRAAFVPTFLDPATGVLAGWKSADGALHDYWFTFVNGVAISYGLVDGPQANQIMDRLLRKMDDVGYRCFQYGLPGNLVPIRRGDYYKHGKDGAPRWGEPRQEDGRDVFQIYENGGATGCYAYFTYHALYQLGRTADARRLALPTLRSFAAGGFQGFDPTGESFDWRDWSGRGHGYEGFLVDNYLSLLTALDEAAVRHP